LILSTHLCFALPSGLFPSDFPTNIPICVPPLPHSHYMPCPSRPPWLNHSNYTWRRVQLEESIHFVNARGPALNEMETM
jgi:hypothetical protein